MLVDLVLDTNVLMHAANEVEDRKAAAERLLLTLLRDSKTTLCVDEGFHVDEASNRSVIGSEYLKHLRAPSLGYQLVTQMALDGRISMVSRSVERAVGKTIDQLLRNKVDRTFLRVACNSDERLLCSHDFRDYSEAKRTTIRKRLTVTVLDASATQPLVTDD